MAEWPPPLEAVVTPAFWKDRRVFVTGHTGFKGAWLVALLDHFGARVTGYALEAIAPDHRCVVWHSHLSEGERLDGWLALATGEARIVVGARSAVFAPVQNLRLIVVDEEHEPAYKQDETPRYHGRDVAVMRAKLNRAVCVLGSATPSLGRWCEPSTPP